RQDSIAHVALEIFPVRTLRGNRLLQIFHAVYLVLLSKLVELFDHVGLDVDTHVLAALDEEGLIDQIAQGVFLAVLDVGAQLFRGALALAFLPGVLFGGDARLVQLGKGDDLVVDARDDFFDRLGIRAFHGLFSFGRLLNFGGLFFWLGGSSARLFEYGRIRFGRLLR